MEYLPFNENDYDTLYEKLTKSSRTAYIVGAVFVGAYFLLMFVPAGLIPTRRPTRLDHPEQTMMEIMGTAGYNLIFAIFAAIFAAVWYFAEYKKLDEDYDNGEKIRFKAVLRNLKNIPDDKTLFLAELGPNELNLKRVKMPLPLGIRLNDTLVFEVTPQYKVVLSVEKATV